MIAQAQCTTSDQQGFSLRNLAYMQAFTALWPGAAIVQRLVARCPCAENSL